MPTTILDGETYSDALHRRHREEAEYAKRFQHTPGPWELGEIEQAEDGGAFVDIDGKNLKYFHSGLARVVWRMEDDERSPTQEANARLIAAAPDLLEALQGFLVMTEGQSIYHFMEPQQKAAKAAIAKALGDSE